MTEVVGLIDCTHVAIIPPADNPPVVEAMQYFNDKGYYSINVQLVIDHNLKIRNINARYSGSADDYFIFMHSKLRNHLLSSHKENSSYGWLLGDTEYQLEPWILVPYPEPNSASKIRFNSVLADARSAMENFYGLMKNRFRCLLKSNTLHYAPEQAGKIINACAVLHNLCIKYNVPVPPMDSGVQSELIQDKIHDSQNSNQAESQTGSLFKAASAVRDRIAKNL